MEINFYSWKSILIFTNAVFGLCLFEMIWFKLRRVRKMESEFSHINKNFPAYKRNDVKEWARWKYWPGALTVLIPRLLSVLFLFIVVMIFCFVV
jgi:hypothetical protein